MTMRVCRLAGDDDRAGFWREARRALVDGVSPQHLRFISPGSPDDLFGGSAAGTIATNEPIPAVIDPRLAELIDEVVIHADIDRFTLAYRLLWRTQSEPDLASVASDRDIARARDMAKAVHRDKHKMKAFVRFQEVTLADASTKFVAWFEPGHHIVNDVAPFFAARFTGMCWSILTPRRSAHWDGETLTLSAGARKADAPDGDPLDEVWRTYYASTFNPARLKVKAMTAQMPKKYWHNMPEARLIPQMVRAAGSRVSDMIDAAPTTPHRASASAVAVSGCRSINDGSETLQSCRRCPLWKQATQAVPGEGPADARLMIVGEQPGDQEDIAGRPFVGPAGQLLSKALERSEIDRGACYLTNAVKHFKFEPRGKRRLHKNPSRDEIDHCRWWLDQERALVRPKVVLALGVSALRGLTGKTVTLTSVRTHTIPLDDGSLLVPTVHPAYLLRLTDEAQKREEWGRFLADLKTAKQILKAA